MRGRLASAVLMAVVLVAVALVSGASAAKQGTIKLRGVDSQNVRPFTLSKDADVAWSCPGCSNSNFIFDATQAPGIVNALNHTHGTSFLARGHYSGVSVAGSGSWTITLRPSVMRPVSRSYLLTGVDSQNLKPITITHDSNVAWSCPGCSQSNFIFDAAESPGIVNALNHTHGTSFLAKGHYTGVSVAAAGYWKIIIR
jgi:rubredoxin